MINAMDEIVDPPGRVQLCGELSILLDGREHRDGLRGGQARALFAFLVLERHRPVDRFDLIDALWGTEPPRTASESLRSLLSNLRRTIGPQRLTGREEIRLLLPPGTRVDVEAAARAVHDAESAIALGRWEPAWLAAHVSMNIASRPLLPRLELPWAEQRRAALEEIRLRSLEALAASGVAL